MWQELHLLAACLAEHAVVRSGPRGCQPETHLGRSMSFPTHLRQTASHKGSEAQSLAYAHANEGGTAHYSGYVCNTVHTAHSNITPANSRSWHVRTVVGTGVLSSAVAGSAQRGRKIRLTGIEPASCV